MLGSVIYLGLGPYVKLGPKYFQDQSSTPMLGPLFTAASSECPCFSWCSPCPAPRCLKVVQRGFFGLLRRIPSPAWYLQPGSLEKGAL